MDVAVVTGAAGLVGQASVRLFADQGLIVVGVDNDLRSRFFGPEASTRWAREALEAEVPGYRHVDADVRDRAAMERLFAEYGADIRVVVHAAAQPSHDWAAQDPYTDFDVNARATLVLLECTRRFAPQAVFIYTSTNKVYGDAPNRLPLVELETRWEVEEGHPYYAHGIDESMSIDRTTHSLFGASKSAADLLVQEYGRYFGLKTGCFRGGCLTGPAHSGARLHGFLAYLVRCALTGDEYTIYGYKGKQVRDNIHARDLADMFWHFTQSPRPGEVYNVGGSRHSHCSMREAIALCEGLTGRRLRTVYTDQHRIGDHIWWVSDVRRFRAHYPGWTYRYDLPGIMQEIVDGLRARL